MENDKPTLSQMLKKTILESIKNIEFGNNETRLVDSIYKFCEENKKTINGFKNICDIEINEYKDSLVDLSYKKANYDFKKAKNNGKAITFFTDIADKENFSFNIKNELIDQHKLWQLGLNEEYKSIEEFVNKHYKKDFLDKLANLIKSYEK